MLSDWSSGVNIVSKINYEAAIEAILFTMGESVEIEKIANALEITKKQVKNTVKQMQSKLESEDRGIRIIELEDSYQLCTKPEMYDALVKIAKQPRKQVMTDVLMETLSIIAYKQPITKGEIERIRGVKCDHAVNKLVEYELVQEVGRMETPGRPLLFGTTEEFLRRFGVDSSDNLPMIDMDKIEEFKEEAEKEVSIKSND
ncbi:MAG: SMC-Scp complex subunit ScpB [Lachnospiraceae bacterium]|nr:SMC-Scp complex subunit ScpB [Lachnospiraceae bacterium]